MFPQAVRRLLPQTPELRVELPTLNTKVDDYNQNYVSDPWDAKWKSVSTIGLRDLARKHLEAPRRAGLVWLLLRRGGPNFQAIVDGLNEFEAVDLDGNAAGVQQYFAKTGLPGEKRIVSKGVFNTWWNSADIFTQLLHGGRDAGTGVDRVIFGLEKTAFYDHEWTRTAAGEIAQWVESNGVSRTIAGISDSPW
ncbi:uncharacterized protein B0I36DRAFT_382520 [Microdochium trichocladiopsis]|uniref:Uncharacterized protein n=1 Tax=Microdochium trichocladiopsis TaxID=1682393 RepID=A0A9P8YD90_9PEZI|nr:uncharacterized protein B0I36DRAFT_382520 [Microdochium trichocladiopsis]KAH7035904.1 hypothetical protein B0I36DRAFT_382520 [Microdochium trichocladiopsis]